MAKTPIFDPGTSEIRSPLIAGITEGLSKLSDIINMDTDTTTITLNNVPITDSDKNRIYQAPNGKRLWLSDPAPVFRKNGEIITPETDFFSVDYVGGAIAFERAYRLTETDVVTAKVTYCISSSVSFEEIVENAQAAQGALDAMEGRVSGLEENAEGLAADIQEAFSDVSDLQNRVGRVELDSARTLAELAKAQSDIKGIQGDMSDVESHLSDIDSQVEEAQASIDYLDGKLNDLLTAEDIDELWDEN